MLEPSVDAIVINPICPHSLHSRPLVVGSSSKICVRANGQCAAHICVDGISTLAFGADGSELMVSKSAKTVNFVRDRADFYGKLLTKMNAWGKTEQHKIFKEG